MVDQRKLDLLSDLVAKELKSRREAVGLSKNEVATRSGLAVSFVSYLESGKRKPTIETLTRLALVFGTSASDLLAVCEKQVKFDLG
jgi:transcriptional regulator with XRE-family HTH domain